MLKKVNCYFQAPVLGWLLVIATFFFCMPGMGTSLYKHAHEGGEHAHHHHDDGDDHNDEPCLLCSAESKEKKTRDDIAHTHLVHTADVNVCCPPELAGSCLAVVSTTMDLQVFPVMFPDEPLFEMIKPPQLG